MCGITGISLAEPAPQAGQVVARMADTIRHRGPDSGGLLSSAEATAHLGFRRLAIRDLNARADQPMVSASGKTALVFNGEVYNSEDLAQRLLPDVTLRTSGDAEVVLETLEKHGLGVLHQFNGMFALALLDTATGRITLARDRMGKKPLYLYEANGLVAFGSELRALKPFGLRVDTSHIELFLHFGYFPSPFTFFRNTTQVRPGEIIQIFRGKIVGRHRFHGFAGEAWSQGPADYVHLESLLDEATDLRTLSDVPLGAFLSGGVDSALVCAHLARRGGEPTPTFTVTFTDATHDESAAAAATAAELSLPHHVINIEEHDLPSLAREFSDCYEQPFADTSGLVTMLLCRAVKPRITVALAGDGGDEFFGGYTRYRWFRQALWAQKSPRGLRLLAGIGLAREPRRGRRISRWLAARDPAELYTEILRNWTASETRRLIPDVEGISPTPTDLVREVFQRTPADPLAQAACFDATHYIPDDLQVKIDRASMRVALEVRCPLLDYRLARAGASVLTSEKYRDGLKSVLKNLLGRHISPAVSERPKRGFAVPLARWLGGPLRSFVGDTLGQRSVREVGWFNAATGQEVWKAFLAGRTHNAHAVWMLLSLVQHARDVPADPLFSSLQSQPRTRQKVA